MSRLETIALSTGVALPVLLCGDLRSATPLLLLHGYSDSHLSMQPLIDSLPESVPILAPTQRGHGDAEKPPGGYAIVDLANDVTALLDAFGLARVHVAGHSMGAAVAATFAAREPARVARLVLMGAFADFRDKPEVRALNEEVQALSDPVDAAFVRAFQQSTLSQPVAPAFFEMVVAESLKLPARVWQALCEGFLAHDLPGALAAVRAPTLVVWGDEDGFCSRADQGRLVAEIPDAHLSIHHGANHALHWERPGAVAADVAAFLAARDE